MKKKIFFIVCFLVALTTGSVMANNNLNNVSASEITYSISIDLGNISEMSAVEVSDLLDDALSSIDMEMFTEELQCSVTVEVNVGILKVSGTVSGDCSKVVAAAKKLAQELKEAFT